jgi:hypothetical protein
VGSRIVRVWGVWGRVSSRVLRQGRGWRRRWMRVEVEMMMERLEIWRKGM